MKDFQPKIRRKLRLTLRLLYIDPERRMREPIFHWIPPISSFRAPAGSSSLRRAVPVGDGYRFREW